MATKSGESASSRVVRSMGPREDEWSGCATDTDRSPTSEGLRHMRILAQRSLKIDSDEEVSRLKRIAETKKAS